MSYFSNAKRGKIVGVHLAGTSVSRSARRGSISRTAVSKIMTDYINLKPVSVHIIQRELYAAKIHGRIAIPKPLVSAWNAVKILQWFRNHLNWTQPVIWPDVNPPLNYSPEHRPCARLVKTRKCMSC
ncbi:hypothetical protein TNCV_149081 [Trichonephila clavipes]|nr:hypothetical protein TNCV_149081 [Trichonephila clavipes]